MYRTDRQFMKNPATACARIYIGSLAKTVLADDLEAKFKAHGNILGLVLQTGFAFIQYEHDYEAHLAIENEHGTQLHGRKLNVKQALEKPLNKPLYQKPNNGPALLPKPNGPPTNFQHQQAMPPKSNQGPPLKLPVGPAQQTGPQNVLQEKPMEKDMEDDEDPESDRPNIRPPAHNQPMNVPPKPMSVPPGPHKPLNVPPGPNKQMNLQPGQNTMNIPPGPQKLMNIPPGPQNPMLQEEEENQRGRPLRKFNNRGPIRGRSNDRFEPPPRDAFRERPPFYGREEFHGPAPYIPPIVDAPHPDRNDCEIIVVAKALTEYAEYIEQRLKQLGLIVDLLFPNEDVPIGRVLANISSRGCLYAILVMPQNEEHRSMTLNVLHGLPQEHRNMPIEDAFLLISRNFEAYMRGEQTAPETQGQMTLADRHPVPMQMVLNLLAENRQLTSSQYDKLLKYLQERRELQYQHELIEGIEQDSQETSGSKQAELQSRIMNILNSNKGSEATIPASITAPDPVPVPPAAPTPLLKDPSVQKALDSLMLGDMFKNMAG